MEKFIKDVEPEKIKDKSSKDSLEDKDKLGEELVTLQEQETLIIEETQEINTLSGETFASPKISEFFLDKLSRFD